MTEFLTWLVALALLSLQPRFCFTHDRRNFDGDRYVEFCGGIYQQPYTWVCVEVPR